MSYNSSWVLCHCQKSLHRLVSDCFVWDSFCRMITSARYCGFWWSQSPYKNREHDPWCHSKSSCMPSLSIPRAHVWFLCLWNMNKDLFKLDINKSGAELFLLDHAMQNSIRKSAEDCGGDISVVNVLHTCDGNRQALDLSTMECSEPQHILQWLGLHIWSATVWLFQQWQLLEAAVFTDFITDSPNMINKCLFILKGSSWYCSGFPFGVFFLTEDFKLASLVVVQNTYITPVLF